MSHSPIEKRTYFKYCDINKNVITRDVYGDSDIIIPLFIQDLCELLTIFTVKPVTNYSVIKVIKRDITVTFTLQN